MSKYRSKLSHLRRRLFVTDGGMGTTLLFHEGVDLPHFCAFHLLDDEVGREILARHFRNYGSSARELEMGFVVDRGPACYMVSCAHPTHLADVLTLDECWTNRIKGIRLNASCLSHTDRDARGAVFRY